MSKAFCESPKIADCESEAVAAYFGAEREIDLDLHPIVKRVSLIADVNKDVPKRYKLINKIR